MNKVQVLCNLYNKWKERPTTGKNEELLQLYIEYKRGREMLNSYKEIRFIQNKCFNLILSYVSL